MTFTIQYPPSLKGYGLNDIYAGKHWAKRKKDSEYWHWIVHSELNKQGIRKKLFKKPVEITFNWNDRLDVDNHAYIGKMIVDALKGYLIADDTRKYFVKVAHQFHEGKYILVEVKEV